MPYHIKDATMMCLNLIIFHERSPNSAAFLSNLLGNITWSSDGKKIVSASSCMTTWILEMPEEDSFIDKGGSYVDPIAENWEDKFIDLLATDRGYIVSIIIKSGF